LAQIVKLDIRQMDPAGVRDNQILSMSSDSGDIERCGRIISAYGVYRPPVVGRFSDGSQMIVSGECEFQGLREIGARTMEAVAVDVSGPGDGHRLMLLLASLRKGTSALSEALLIKEALANGDITQEKIGAMLGKSPGWVSKRMALVTQLAPEVYDMVRARTISPYIAQEVARLPTEEQHTFAVNAAKGCLPKSAVEALVAAYRRPDCPDEVKRQIVAAPKDALPRMVAGHKEARPDGARLRPPREGRTLRESAELLRQYVSVFYRFLYYTPAEEAEKCGQQLGRLLEDIELAAQGIREKLGMVSPGKDKGVAAHVG